MAQLKDLIARYEEIRAKKDYLSDETKANNEAFEEIKQEIADQMIEDDNPSTTIGGYTYSLQNKTNYSFKSAEKLAALGVDKFEVLRENGFDYLIKETVDQRTLSSAMNEIEANDNEEIPDPVMDILSIYESQDILRRKATTRAKKTKTGGSSDGTL